MYWWVENFFKVPNFLGDLKFFRSFSHMDNAHTKKRSKIWIILLSLWIHSEKVILKIGWRNFTCETKLPISISRPLIPTSFKCFHFISLGLFVWIVKTTTNNCIKLKILMKLCLDEHFGSSHCDSCDFKELKFKIFAWKSS